MQIRKLHSHEMPPMDLLLTADPSRTLVEDYLRNGQCFVAELNERLVGVYVLLPTQPDTIELVNIAVDEKLHGMGLGKNLVFHAIETARLQGYKTIEVGTGNSSIGQMALYQKCGFRMTGIDRDFFVRHYPGQIFENGIQCVDKVRFARDL